MAASAQLQLFSDDARTANDSPWVSYSSSGKRIFRHVIERRSGETKTSAVTRLAATTDLAADYDLSWLLSKKPPQTTTASRNVSFADLFAGCGAMSLGLAEACRGLGFSSRSALASELDPVKAETYAKNFCPNEMMVGPIELELDGELGAKTTAAERALTRRVGDVEFLIGGPPCQGHSDLNNHTRRKDDRNQLITRMARFAELFNPKHIVIENVQGVRHDRHSSASTTASYLRSIGYHTEEILVPCGQLGVPQNRRRYMLIASKKRLEPIAKQFEVIRRPERPVSWAISDLLDILTDETFDSAAVHSSENQRRINFLFKHKLYDLPNEERPPCHRLKEHAYNSVYGRMRWQEPSPTITTGFGSTGQGRFVHPLKPRTLTPHEAARLQTIPDFFDFGDPGRTQLQKMIGNSVPPLAMVAVALHVLR